MVMGGSGAGYEPTPMLSFINLGYFKLVFKKHLNQRLSDTRCDEVHTALLREARMSEIVEAVVVEEEARRAAEFRAEAERMAEVSRRAAQSRAAEEKRRAQ